MEDIRQWFLQLYGATEDNKLLIEQFIDELSELCQTHDKNTQNKDDWYKDAVVYAMYVQDYNRDFKGLIARLDELTTLGITCLWLLPILKSPMQDAGFDISDFTAIRSELLSDSSFEALIDAAHAKGIRIIFDIALNHCSDEHSWFQAARQDEQSTYRDYFIWSDSSEGYAEARIIFKGICQSNWQYDTAAGQYYFHRFFEIQPDLNYRHPPLLLEMCRVLISWKLKGIDGFRADAIPYIWKEPGTNCENLPEAHTIIKFMRAVLAALDPSTLLLAEACQPPSEVVAYFGDGNECQGAYHFPVMPRIYLALATADNRPIIETLSPAVTPAIPDNCQWFMFLRCHDELTLEMVSESERQVIYQHYAKLPAWDFRQGEGISARLADLFDGDVDRIMLAYSIMFSLPGTPIIYYGDEYGKGNDYDYHHSMVASTGIHDSRYLVRGPIDWQWVASEMADAQSLSYQLFNRLRKMISVRSQHLSFARGTLSPLEGIRRDLLVYVRHYHDERTLIVQNLAGHDSEFSHPILADIAQTLLGQKIARTENAITLSAHQYAWLLLK